MTYTTGRTKLVRINGEAVPPIAAARRRLGITLQELAHAAAIDPAHLELMERGSLLASPTLAELERIADTLHLDVREIRCRAARAERTH
jgi:transcriptional regulator with XRE-family HTH domain